MRFNHSFQSTLCLLAILAAFIATRLHAQDSSAPSEEALIAVLQSDAELSEKAITCKQLAIHGSSAAVPELAKLLPNPQLSSWARIALESIPGPESDAALRQAAADLEGKLLVGTINSIGVRKDQDAVGVLTNRIGDSDEDVAAAAAVALGHIGGPDAVGSLRSALPNAADSVKSAIAEGLVLSAEQLLAGDDSAAAVEIYDELRSSDLPQQRIIEATRGAILARGDDGIPMLLELCKSRDKHLFNLALGTVREFPGSKIDKELVGTLPGVSPDRAALILLAMADRPDTVDLPSILAAAKDGPPATRVAAVRALGQVGDASCLPALLEIGLEKDEQLREMARATLATLPGQDVDSLIVERLSEAKGAIYPLLIDLVGKRQILATPSLLKALDHGDAAVRISALQALGETVEPAGLSVLIAQVIKPKNEDEGEVAQRALKAASVRMPDREACSKELAAALATTDSVPKQVALLQTLGAVGGTHALQTIGESAASGSPELQDIGSRLLGTWMTADAAPVLLELSQSDNNRYKVRALRGYLRIARQFVLPEEERAAMCRKALNAASRPAEKELVLQILERYPNASTLKVAMEASKDSELKSKATQTALLIAQKVGGDNEELSEFLSQAGLPTIKLEIVKAEYGAGSQQKDVTALVRKSASDFPLISLPSPSYNAAFGGDPVPGTQKQLRIIYRINGEEGEATFAENEPIFLKTP